MCDRGDTCTSYGQAIAEVANKNNLPLIPDRDGKEVWDLYASVNKYFVAALKLELDNLGISNKLGDLSLIRANLDLPIAERNKFQSLKNAQFYFKRAVEMDKEALTSGYIGWAMREWALENWFESSLKVIETWIKHGGNGQLFRNLAKDSDFWGEDFVNHVTQAFFAADEEVD